MESVDVSSVTHSFLSCDDELGSLNVTVAPDVVLCGRAREISQLMEAFTNLCTIGQPQRVVIHGVSGSGKTSLVDVLRKPVIDRGGFFASGKYFQNSAAHEPYSAVMAALSDLCDLAVQSKYFMEERRADFEEMLGLENAYILKKTISNLSPLLEQMSPNRFDVADDAEIRNATLFTKFKVACRTFLRAISCSKNPIVLFIDDIQWMDEGSSELLELLINDHMICHVMIVLAYRDEEAARINDFLRKIQVGLIRDIPLRNLDMDGIDELISNLFGSTASLTELRSIIATKTVGNPLHTLQLIGFIQTAGFMFFNPETNRWELDADKIRSDVMVSSSLANLLALKIRSLPDFVLQSMKIACLLGFRFNENLVVSASSFLLDHEVGAHGLGRDVDSVCALSVGKVAAAISEAELGGFVEKAKGMYQFSHDTLQHAFHSLIDEQEKELLHMAIGKAWLAIGDAESKYRASIHLHSSPSFVHDDETRIFMARLHLDAATYCRAKSAFVDAAISLYRGLHLLDLATKWTENFDLAFAMTDLLARIELILGNHDSCTKYLEEVLLHARTMEMKINALLIAVECFMAQNDVEGSIAAAHRALCSLGIQMPRRVLFRHIGFKLVKVKLMLRGKSDQDILAIPLMRNEVTTAAARILVNQCNFCFLKDEQKLGVYSALVALELMLNSGLNPHSACALTVYGVALLSQGDHRGAYRFGKLSLRLLDMMKARDAHCPTTVLALTLLTHWYEPVCDMPRSLRQAAMVGLEVGDVVFATYGLAVSYSVKGMLGSNLRDLDISIRADELAVRDFTQDGMLMWMRPAMQYFTNLQSDDATSFAELTVLTGEFMDEDIFIRQALATNNRILAMIALNYKALLMCMFGFWESATSLFLELNRMGKTFFFSFAAMSNFFYFGLASYSCYQQLGKRKHLKLARKYRSRLKDASKRGCPNAPPYLAFLDAEDKAIQKSSTSTVVAAAYKAAIALAGFPHVEGLAHERAGFYHARQGLRDEAKMYFDKALALYSNVWGATAKRDWLIEMSEASLGSLKEVREGRKVIGTIVDVVDDGIAFGREEYKD